MPGLPRNAWELRQFWAAASIRTGGNHPIRVRPVGSIVTSPASRLGQLGTDALVCVACRGPRRPLDGTLVSLGSHTGPNGAFGGWLFWLGALDLTPGETSVSLAKRATVNMEEPADGQ